MAAPKVVDEEVVGFTAELADVQAQVRSWSDYYMNKGQETVGYALLDVVASIDVARELIGG